MSDFTLDYFFAQLLRYLEKNRDQLERTPYGAHAITEPFHPTSRARSGLLPAPPSRPHRDRATTGQPRPSVLTWSTSETDGRVRFGCANARQVLEVFETTSVGRSEAILRLCDVFNAETDNGQDMDRYDKLPRRRRRPCHPSPQPNPDCQPRHRCKPRFHPAAILGDTTRRDRLRTRHLAGNLKPRVMTFGMPQETPVEGGHSTPTDPISI